MIKFPTNRIVLSSAFTNRMIEGEGFAHFQDLTADQAKEVIALAEEKGVLENAINPAHPSTAALAKGLTTTECKGGFVTLKDWDAVVVMLPSTASRNATEFDLKLFEECQFTLVQRVPVSALNYNKYFYLSALS